MDIPVKGTYRDKIKTVEQIAKLIGGYPRKRKAVMCHGVFDIVHPGHIRHLMAAKEHADILIASLTCDRHINKANMRPYVPEQLRAVNLAAFEMVDFVLIDNEQTACANLKILKPDYYAKGFEYAKANNEKTKNEVEILESYGGEILFTPGDVVYSSSTLIEQLPPNLSIDTLLTTMRAEELQFKHLYDALDSISGIGVHVVGDLIVDTITHTALIGGMSKTPTFSVQVKDKQDYVGGAGIVAKHMKSAGANVTLSTVVGQDSNGVRAIDDLSEYGIELCHVVDPSRSTTNKNAIEAQGYRLLKIDTVDNRPIGGKVLGQIKEDLRMSNADVVAFTDFRHGVFTRETIPALTAIIPAKAFKVADSQVASRWGNILEFKGFDLITPNEREARFALGDQDSVIRPLASRLYEEAQCRHMILKLGERGVMADKSTIGPDHAFHFVGSFVENLTDAVGAGDALLAYSTLTLKATNNILIAAIIGSFAAALECEQDGNIPIRVEAVKDKIAQVERMA